MAGVLLDARSLTVPSHEQASTHQLLEFTTLCRRALDLRRQQRQKITLEARERGLVALRERPGQVQVLDVQLRKLALGIGGGCQPLAKIRRKFCRIQANSRSRALGGFEATR